MTKPFKTGSPNFDAEILKTQAHNFMSLKSAKMYENPGAKLK
jgi:hypothetical protein